MSKPEQSIGEMFVAVLLRLDCLSCSRPKMDGTGRPY
jgi:hypothetical protein